MGDGISSGLSERGLRRLHYHVRAVRAVGVSDHRNSPADGRTFRISAHLETALVRCKFLIANPNVAMFTHRIVSYWFV